MVGLLYVFDIGVSPEAYNIVDISAVEEDIWRVFRKDDSAFMVAEVKGG